jgi:hypothetical protein
VLDDHPRANARIVVALADHRPLVDADDAAREHVATVADADVAAARAMMTMVADGRRASIGAAMIAHDHATAAVIMTAATSPTAVGVRDATEEHAEDRCDSKSASHTHQPSAGEM